MSREAEVCLQKMVSNPSAMPLFDTKSRAEEVNSVSPWQIPRIGKLVIFWRSMMVRLKLIGTAANLHNKQFEAPQSKSARRVASAF